MVFNLAKTHSLVIITIILLFVNNSTFILAKNGENLSFGVNIGDHFNMLVTDIPERPSVSEGGELPAGVNVSALLNINYDNFTLRPIIKPLPKVGTSISMNITQFPNNSLPGIINCNISQNYTKIESNFVLGEPVVSNNWDRWLELINTMEEQKIVDDKAITVIHLEVNETYFTSILLFKPTIPDVIKLLVPSIEIKQTLRYFVTSGIRDLIKVDISISVVFFGTSLSTTSLKYISDSYSKLESSSSSSPPSSLDNFPFIIIPIIIFVPVAVLLMAKRYRKLHLTKK